MNLGRFVIVRCQLSCDHKKLNLISFLKREKINNKKEAKLFKIQTTKYVNLTLPLSRNKEIIMQFHVHDIHGTT